MATGACSICFCAVRIHSRTIGQKFRGPVFRNTNRIFTASSRYYVAKPKVEAVPKSTTQAPEAPQAPKPIGYKAASELRRVTGRTTDTYAAYGVTETLFKECSKQAEYTIPEASDANAEMPKTADGEDLGIGDGWWHTELGLNPTFSTWSQVTMLHMYFLCVRFRCFPADFSQPWQQHLLDHFFYEAENKMVINHNMHARGTRNKYLKDLFIQWRGLLAAYDEGITKGDAVLAGAIWRNVFKADEEVDVTGVAAIVSYMRRGLREMDQFKDEDLTSGMIEFGNPKYEMEIVAQKSKMVQVSFKEESDAGSQQETH